MPQLYKKGQSGNPRGATSLTMLRTHENARRAVEIRNRLLRAYESRIADIEVRTMREFAFDPEEGREMVEKRITALISSDLNRLLADSENRGLGAPRQFLEVETVRTEKRLEEYSDDELLAIAEGGDIVDASFEELPAPEHEDGD
jgi:hypothetical protein